MILRRIAPDQPFDGIPHLTDSGLESFPIALRWVVVAGNTDHWQRMQQEGLRSDRVQHAIPDTASGSANNTETRGALTWLKSKQ